MIDTQLAPEGSGLPVGPGRLSSPVAAGAPLLDATLANTLAWWLRGAPSARLHSREDLAQALARDLTHLDALLTAQLNAILHHPSFQRLEASWRQLADLVARIPEEANIKVRVLNVSWEELGRDIRRAFEFDQSQIFRKVYSEEFGMPGGEPFGVLIGDYTVTHRPVPGTPRDDLRTLEGMAEVAAAAFAPFIAAADPTLLDLESFAELERPLDLAKTFDQTEYVRWRALRAREDARFLALALPRVLVRRPYRLVEPDGKGFLFDELVSDRASYLWGNPAYPFATVLIRAFAVHGWLADIRGVRAGEGGGGFIDTLPAQAFPTDRLALAPLACAEVMITEAQEVQLDDLGLLCLCDCYQVPAVAFHSVPSLQRPVRYDDPAANANARMSATLSYLLCASRFAHYLKVILRDRTGAFSSAADVETFLARWLLDYCTASEDVSAETQARCPLREARVVVREAPGQPGSYRCVVHLRPHFQLEGMAVGVRLVTVMKAAPQTGQ